MKHFLCAVATLSAVTASSETLQQDSDNSSTPVVTTASGKIIGRFTAGSFNGSVLISNNNQPVLISLILDTSFSNPGQPLSSGLIWGPRDVFFTEPNCNGQAYITADTTPGGRRLAAPVRQGNQWRAYVSELNPTFSQPTMQSHLSGAFGSCDTNTYTGIWLTRVQATVSLDALGTPPFFVR